MRVSREIYYNCYKLHVFFIFCLFYVLHFLLRSNVMAYSTTLLPDIRLDLESFIKKVNMYELPGQKLATAAWISHCRLVCLLCVCVILTINTCMGYLITTVNNAAILSIIGGGNCELILFQHYQCVNKNRSDSIVHDGIQ